MSTSVLTSPFIVLKTIFQDTCWNLFSTYISMINVSQRLRDCQKATCVLICLLLWEDLKPVSTTVLPTSFLCPKTVFQDNCSWFVFHNRCTTVKRLLVNLYACCCERNWNLFIRSALVKLQKPRKPTNRKLKEKTTSLLDPFAGIFPLTLRF